MAAGKAPSPALTVKGGAATGFTATGVSIDTRTLQPGDLFVALRGEAGDGHAFVAAALAKGAAGAMVHADLSVAGPLLRVDDTLAALGRLGGYARGRFAGRVVAVTGSVGKTTTKEMLRTVLSAFGPTHAAVASYNNHWGLPLTLARTPRDAAFCVAEIGMNHAGEIAPLARLARPHVAVITAVEAAHIGHLGSIEAIADEKASIFRGLEPGGVAVLPADSSLLPRLRAAAERARVVTFGTAPEADVRLLETVADADGSDVVALVHGRTVRFRLNAPGQHMAMNAMAALAAAVAARDSSPSPCGRGAGEESMARALESFTAVAGRGTRRTLALPGGAVLLLDESYNGNGASMRAALSVLALQPAGRHIAVLGDMLELGDSGPAEHAALAGPVATAADRLFVCGPLMRHLFDAVPPQIGAAHAPDSAALAPIVAAQLRPGDAVLVKGSLGSRMKTIVNALDALTAETR
jgi:UDP-N-acetylmuramoyl-tripeptide--D-alanyl-D-alanine ligase